MNILAKTVNSILFHTGSFLGSFFSKDYLNKARNGKRNSEKTLLKIVRKNRNTVYGKKYGFSEITSIEDFRKNVPLSTYEDYKEYIEQMRLHGTQNLITSTKIDKFATTSGTTNIKKLIPQNPSTYIEFFKCICILLNQFTSALAKRNIPAGYARGFLFTEITDNYEAEDENGSVGYFTQYAANVMKVFIPLFTQMPGYLIGCGESRDKEYLKCRFALQEKDLNFLACPFTSMAAYSLGYIIKNHETLIEDIEKGIVDPKVELDRPVREMIEAHIKPDPKRAAELREAFSQTDEKPLLSALWPDISYLTGIGSADFEPFTKTLIEFMDDDVTVNYSFYACSESLIGFSIYPDEPKYLPIIDLAFFEFIPVDSDDHEKTLLLSELEVGKLYEIIITTKGGFYRYQLKDVVRVVGFEGETPLLEFAYRANHVTDLCGTHITGYHLAESIRDLENGHSVHVTDYCIYPNTDFNDPHIELFVELDRTVNKEEMKKMENSFEEYLCHYAWDYFEYRRVDSIGAVELHIVKKDTFNDYRSSQLSKGASSNQLKALRLIDTEEKLQYFKNNLIEL